MKKLICFSIFVALVWQSGCGLLGIVGVMGTPSSHERKVTAEYDLAGRRDEKILVLVNQGPWLNAEVNLRYYLTEALNDNLVNNIKIKPDNVINYTQLAVFRSGQSNFSLLSPVQIGKAMAADIVLLAEVDDFELKQLPEEGYYKGLLQTRAILFDTATGANLWPDSEKGKVITVGFDMVSGGRAVAVERLVAASAYGTVRFLYNCPKEKFRFADDRSGAHWQNWE